MLLQFVLRRAALPVVAGVLVVLVAAPSLAGTVYRWETEDGTYAFTDDPKRIPARYKDVATKSTMKKLADYPYLTPAPKTDGEYQERLNARLEVLRERQADEEVVDVAAAPPQMAAGDSLTFSASSRVQYRTSRKHVGHEPRHTRRYDRSRSGYGVTLDGEGGPVIAENVRVKSDSPGDHTTKHIWVMSRDGEVLFIQRPQDNMRNVSPKRESELTGLSCNANGCFSVY